MPRYVTRAEADCDWWDNGRPYDSIEVFETGPVDTGLLDAHGNAIWRVKDPIGFDISRA